jgi:hypothetical protein
MGTSHIIFFENSTHGVLDTVNFKMLVEANPKALEIQDNYGALPLHYALKNSPNS